MKIIFDNKEQKIDFIRTISDAMGCPSRYGISGEDCDLTCCECWAKAINAEVKNNENDI